MERYNLTIQYYASPEGSRVILQKRSNSKRVIQKTIDYFVNEDLKGFYGFRLIQIDLYDNKLDIFDNVFIKAEGVKIDGQKT